MEKNRFYLFGFVKPLLIFFIMTAVINLIFVGLDNIIPQIVRVIVDQVIIGKNFANFYLMLSSLLAIGLIRGVLGYAREYFCDTAGSRIGCNIRKDLFAKIQKLSANFFDRINSGELMSRVMDDVNSIWELFTYVGMLCMEIAIHVTVVIFFMFKMNWKLAVFPTAGILICGFISVMMNKYIGPMFGAIFEENSKLNNMVQENIAGVRTVKSFLREKYETAKFRKHNLKYFELNYKQSKTFANFNPIFMFARVLIPLIMLVHGGIFCMQDKITLGELTAFMQYSMNIAWPVEMIGWLSACVARGFQGIKRIDGIYREIPQIEDSPCAREMVVGEIKGAIQFKNVSFTAENKTRVLRNVSFSIEGGKTLGIMGSTGSGKSTVINLLKRMYDITEGQILLDGLDIRDLKLESLRKSIATVSQDVFLFSDTIDSNIRLGEKDELTESSVDRSLEEAAAAQFISKLEDGKNTVIGERGIGLSGGQKQRLTIARALSRTKAPVLVFDDSTSALDTETEKRIQQMLEEKKNAIKIIIAHRISAVKHADLILVMENGSVAECGTHLELLEKKGLYWQTWQIQNDL